jgi:hypothetical protein
MMKRFALLFAIGALAIASAKSYSIKVLQPVVWGNAELKPGEYKLEVTDQKAVVRMGKLDAEANVKVEDGTEKYDKTSMRLAESGGKFKVSEVRIGGTKTKLVFND